jgi:hypothetical protein
VDAITIITGPRTGAGHLFALLRNIEAVAPRDGLFADGHADATARMDTAEAEARAEGKSLLVVKATSAMPRDIVERELLGRTGMRAVVVVRRQIDAYVSLAKATALNAFRDRDLTGVKVRLDPAHFASWLEEQEDWYGHWQEWLLRRSFPVPILRYETHLAVPPESALRRFASAAAQVGITVRVPSTLAHPGLTRQDREPAAAFRVKNWVDFSKALLERDIEKRAFGYPI